MNAHVEIESFLLKTLRTVQVPFTALKRGKDLPEVPAVALLGRNGRLEMGVAHAFYVVMQQRAIYTEEDLLRLGGFIAEQDMLRAATSPLKGGFAVPVALISKVDPRSNAYAYGKRWAYHVTEPDGTVRTVAENSLEKLLTRLGRA